MLGLQRTAGNQAVSALVDDSAAVVARSPAAPATTRKVDDMHTLQQLAPMTLIVLYISTDAQFVNGKFEVPQANASFTKDGIFPLRPAILELIAEKMEAQHDRAGVYREMVNSKPGDEERKGKVKDLLTHEVSQDLKGRLTEEEGRTLRNNAKDEIVESMSAFGSACQNQKADVRAELAEEGELFAFILEIAFSFIMPVAGKGLAKLATAGMKKETIELLSQLAEHGGKEAVDGALKGAQRQLKAVHSANASKSAPGSKRSEAESFIDGMEKHARNAGKEVRHQVDRMTYGEAASTLEEFSSKTVDIYESQIAEALEKFRKSAGHVGETRYWEYGYKPGGTMGGDTQAAKIQTAQGMRIALVTYETTAYQAKPSHFQPVFVDWVPRDMEEITVTKSKNMYGEPIELSGGDYKVPAEYQKRWLVGFTGGRARE
jgi:hypothetical protein